MDTKALVVAVEAVAVRRENDDDGVIDLYVRRATSYELRNTKYEREERREEERSRKRDRLTDGGWISFGKR